MRRLLQWFAEVNGWAEPIAATLEAPIWIVLSAVYGVGALAVGWIGSRAMERRVAAIETRTGAIAEGVAAGGAERAELKRSIDDQKAMIAQVLEHLRKGARGADATGPASEIALRDAVERLASSGDAQKQAALAKAAEGDVLAAARDLERLAEQQRSEPEPMWSETAETFKEAGALAFHSDAKRSVRNYEAARALTPDDAQVLNQLGHLYQRLGRLDDADRAYRTILGGQGESDDAWRAVALSNKGVIALTRGDLDEAERSLRQSLALHETLGDARGQAANLGNLGRIARTRGRLDEAEALLQRGLELQEAVGSVEGQAAALVSLGAVAQTRGRLDEAETLYNRALGLYGEIENPEGHAAALGNLGLIAKDRGQLDEAADLFERALNLQERHGILAGQGNHLGNLGLLARSRGRLQEAESLHARALALDEELGSLEGMATHLGNLGVIAQTHGQLDDAQAFHTRALALHEKLGRPEGQANQIGNLGAIAQTRGQLDEAERLYQRALALHEGIGSLEGQAILLANLGMVSLGRGDVATARDRLRRARALYVRLGIDHEVRWCDDRLAEADRVDAG